MKKLLDYTDNIICDKLKTFENYGHNDYLAAVNGITGYRDPNTQYAGQNWVYVKVNGISTLANLKTWLESNNLNVVYTLATPVSYSLTTGQVLSLLGQNNVWADTGDIQSLSYVRNTVPEMIHYDSMGQIGSVRSEVESVESAMVILVDGDTAPKAIASGKYLFVKNNSTLATGMYHATANIANGASVTSSNVAGDPDGAINALLEMILALQ